MLGLIWKSRGKKTSLGTVSLADPANLAKSKGGSVEDQDKSTEEQEDVEAHRGKKKFQASEDKPDETESEEDFELHRKTPKAL